MMKGPSVSYVLVILSLLLTLAFTLSRRRWWCNARSGRLPDQSSPFISFTQQLERGEWMARVSFDAEHFGNHLQLLAGFAEDFEPHTTTYVGQLSREVHERTLWANVLG